MISKSIYFRHGCVNSVPLINPCNHTLSLPFLPTSTYFHVPPKKDRLIAGYSASGSVLTGYEKNFGRHQKSSDTSGFRIRTFLSCEQVLVCLGRKKRERKKNGNGVIPPRSWRSLTAILAQSHRDLGAVLARYLRDI